MPQVTPDNGETGNSTAPPASGTDRRADRDDRRARVRMCALTRQELPIDRLIRFVAAPDGVLYPDLARDLPGRGVWISGDRPSVEKAIKTNVFARSLKRKVLVPDGLAQTVDDLLAKRAVQALALANKAGLAVCGFDKVSETLDRTDTVALLNGNDAAEGGRRKLDAKMRACSSASDRPAAIVDCLTIDEMSLAMGRANVVHAALKAGGATAKFIAEAERLVRYRLGDATELATSPAPYLARPAAATARADGELDAKPDTGEAAS